ncbi:MAG: C40 family peptidase [Deltaproteobacteria bacterium]|nr:C40 family peptidase [Deltaproteobacteria bacterium]
MTSPRIPAALAALALAGAGCAAPVQARRPLPPPPAASESRTGAPTGAGPAFASTAARPAPSREARLAVETASALVGRRSVTVDGKDYGSDCAALVRAALDRAGHAPPPEARSARRLYALAEQRGALRPGNRLQPGDVVFLSDRPGGAPDHAGLVARADPDGTALVLHRMARGVARMRVNLAWPRATNDPATGRLVNDTLFVDRKPVPAGSLVVGVADLLR